MRAQEEHKAIMMIELSYAYTHAGVDKHIKDDNQPSLSSNDSIASTISATMVRIHGFKVWNTKEMRLKQHTTVESILDDTSTDSKLLLVNCAGAGKLLTMQMALTISAGIGLIIVPLLALTADKAEKIKRANQNYGSVESHHIDALCPEHSFTILYSQEWREFNTLCP